MELIVALIAELILVVFAPIFVALIESFFWIVAFVGYVLFGQVIDKRPSTNIRLRSKFISVRKHLSIASGVFAVLLGLGFLAALILNTFFFESTVRWIANRAHKQTDIVVSFEEVEGNFFGGTMEFRDLRLVRQGAYPTEYDVRVKSAAIDIKVRSLVFGTPAVSYLNVVGVDGYARTMGDLDEANDVEADGRQETKKARGFKIDDLDIRNIDLTVYKDGVSPLSLKIDNIASTTLRSQFAVFDVFFRSNIMGSVNGAQIQIETSDNGTGRRTDWAISNFPAELVGHYVEKAPFNWFESGLIDVAVHDEWDNRDDADIKMDWRFSLKNVRIKTPGDTGLASRAFAMPIANYINGHEDDVDLWFLLVLNEEQFKTKSSLNAAGLWDAVVDGTSAAIAEKSKSKAQDVRQGIDKTVDSFKQYLDKKRSAGE